jgi:hypothetical protein
MKAFFYTLIALTLISPPLRAQHPDDTLTQAEIDKVRELRYYPADCVLAFVKFLDLRTQEITDLYAKPRRPGREQDTHDLLDQFTAIADELSDNLDEYGPRHADLRRALPKILEATDRWSSALKSNPPRSSPPTRLLGSNSTHRPRIPPPRPRRQSTFRTESSGRAIAFLRITSGPTAPGWRYTTSLRRAGEPHWLPAEWT